MTQRKVLLQDAGHQLFDELTDDDLATPPGGGAVDSVNGQTGVVVLAASDVGADASGAAAAVTTTSIGAVPTSRTITAGTGLTGGGTLAADRTLAADFGSGSGKVTQGNDSRLSDSRAPSGSAGGDLSGTYPNPSVVDDSHSHTAATLPAPGTPITDTLAGDGVTTTFALSQTPSGTWLIATVNGVVLLPSECAISGSNAVFGTAPASASEVTVSYVYGGGLSSAVPALTIVRTGGTAPFPPVSVSRYQDGGVISDTLVSAVFTLPIDATALAFPNLAYIPVAIDHGVLLWDQAALTSLDLGALVACIDFSPSMAALTTLDLSALEVVGGDFAGTMNALTTLDLSALRVVSDTFVPTLHALTTIDVSGLQYVGGNFTITGAALNQASVNGILIALAALNGTGGTTSYNSHTVNLSGGTSSAPSGAGATAKTTLQGRGNTVTTN